MKILETIILVLALLFGLIGGVPDFCNKAWKTLWRVYWTLAAASLLVLVWVELPEMFFNVLLAVGFAWLWIPVVAGMVSVAGVFLYCVGYLVYYLGYGIGMLVQMILLGLYELIFAPVFDRVSDKRMMRFCEDIISGKLSVSEESMESAKSILSNLRMKYHINDDASKSIVQTGGLTNPIPNGIDKECCIYGKLKVVTKETSEKKEKLFRWVEIIIGIAILIYCLIKVILTWIPLWNSHILKVQTNMLVESSGHRGMVRFFLLSDFLRHLLILISIKLFIVSFY